MQSFLTAFQEPDGKVSMNRILAFMFGFVTICLYTWFSLKKGEFVKLDIEAVAMASGPQAIAAIQSTIKPFVITR